MLVAHVVTAAVAVAGFHVNVPLERAYQTEVGTKDMPAAPYLEDTRSSLEFGGGILAVDQERVLQIDGTLVEPSFGVRTPTVAHDGAYFDLSLALVLDHAYHFVVWNVASDCRFLHHEAFDDSSLGVPPHHH